MLVSLAITSLLLTAVMVSIDASFRAYAYAAESASSQVSTRMVVHRILGLIRTGTAQGPLLPGDQVTGLPNPTFNGDLITSSYLILTDRDDNQITLEYRSAEEMLYLTVERPGLTPVTTPLLGGVTDCSFVLRRRKDLSTGLFVLERGSIDMTVVPDGNASLDLEASATTEPIRVVASTAPRRFR